MRLSTIKLAGFKSFVDPTTLPLPTNMTGVVGPNGCGKSNIIDAIRWVMGESAASRLRGDALTDVIFAGSTTRKPVGQATVELIFDNSDGGIQGEYGAYAEISVKRLVARDGQSVYFLNGSRCRRRDITDLFLGTGLGPRSYSIIEQGMISQIVEARPEDLRVHLEEAAGISRYKDRRRETESRMRATRENMERVADVRNEVDKQLEHLQRQARAAERWTALKQEQGRKDAEWRALEYRHFMQQHDAELAGLQTVEAETRQAEASQRELEASLETARGQQHEAGQQLNRSQAKVYQIGAELARIEQQIRFQRETSERLQRDRAALHQDELALNRHLTADGLQLQQVQADIDAGEPKLEALQNLYEEAGLELRQAEQTLADWQRSRDELQQMTGEVSRLAEVERTRLGLLQRQHDEVVHRAERLAAEAADIDTQALAAGLETLHEDEASQQALTEALSEQAERHQQMLEQHLEHERNLQKRLDTQRRELQQAHGRASALQALQAAALGQEDHPAQSWLAAAQLTDAPRLGARLRVQPGWEAAVETVLAGWLDAILVDEPSAHAGELARLEGADVLLLAAAPGWDAGAAETLAAAVEGPAGLHLILSKVHTAPDLEAARARLPGLPAGESVITPDGCWLSPAWVRVRRGQGTGFGVLARERELEVLQARLDALEDDLDTLLAERDAVQQARQQEEGRRDEVQAALHQSRHQLAELAGQWQSRHGQWQQACQRGERLAQEGTQLQLQQEVLATQLQQVRASLETADTRLDGLELQRQPLEEARQGCQDRLEAARRQTGAVQEQVHRLAMTLESRRSSRAALLLSVQRGEGQRLQLQQRRQALEAQLHPQAEPLQALEAEQQNWMQLRQQADQELLQARARLNALESGLRELESARQRLELRLVDLRARHAEQRLATQALQLRAEQQAQAVMEAGLELSMLLTELPSEAESGLWRRQLAELAVKIQRLEPVNLAAIQEYAEQGERRVYLERQLADLSAALETLESAIRKIDRETRALFKETFERVDAGMQTLFPRLFGGGQAYLELTGDDLLSTGVSIMARPPGKKVSNISLLSGGEKALTAVALVFAIFGLNPAPFCLLDEVDAPLDEANVGRFSAMVREMSEKVQFIFVSHNKATMEAASQLCGVTMGEPGVSRLVQVDLAEAARLAGTA